MAIAKKPERDLSDVGKPDPMAFIQTGSRNTTKRRGVVLEARKREARQETEFACFVKNTTPKAVKVTVPLGFVERLPRTTDAEYILLVERNRARYCGSSEDTREDAVNLPGPKCGFALGAHEVF